MPSFGFGNLFWILIVLVNRRRNLTAGETQTKFGVHCSKFCSGKLSLLQNLCSRQVTDQLSYIFLASINCSKQRIEKHPYSFAVTNCNWQIFRCAVPFAFGKYSDLIRLNKLAMTSSSCERGYSTIKISFEVNERFGISNPYLLGCCGLEILSEYPTISARKCAILADDGNEY